MKTSSLLPVLSTFLLITANVHAASPGPAFYGDAPDEHHPWAVHDPNRPQPKVVTPGTFSSPEQPGTPPSDAVVLFDGTDLSKWESARDGKPAKWLITNGVMQVAPSTGDIRTKEKFGDCQLHIEWAAPKEVRGDSQGRGNSGIFLMGRVEVQVLDSYNNLTYADGHAASVYSVNPPMANALRPPGEFQVYDIVFRRPIYKDGKPLDPGYVTVFVNGVLAQDNTELEGGTGHMARARPGPFPEKGPLELQDHGNPMRFRNIWYRELPPRTVEGGTDGHPLSTEATMAKRKEIAASIRQDAEAHANPDKPVTQMLRLMESLEYEKDEATAQKVEQMAGQYVASLKELPADQLKAKKGEAKHVASAFAFLARFKDVSADFGPKVELDKLIKEKGWDKEDAEGFVSLFDGKTFKGWKPATEHSNTWKIEEGALVARGDRCHLFYVGDPTPFKDFELKVDVMTETNSNGGIYFHTRYQESGWPKYGFETQVNNTHSDWKKTGSLYDIVNVREAGQDYKWWTQDITVKSNRVTIKIDGKTVVDYTEPPDKKPGEDFTRKLDEGTFALQAHDPKSVVRYKNIRVKRLE